MSSSTEALSKVKDAFQRAQATKSNQSSSSCSSSSSSSTKLDSKHNNFFAPSVISVPKDFDWECPPITKDTDRKDVVSRKRIRDDECMEDTKDDDTLDLAERTFVESLDRIAGLLESLISLLIRQSSSTTVPSSK